MSEIKYGGLDQYGAEPPEQQYFETVGAAGVNVICSWFSATVQHNIVSCCCTTGSYITSKLLTHMCLSIIWYQPSRVISLAGKETVGLGRSNDSLPPGLPVDWLPRNWDHLLAERS